MRRRHQHAPALRPLRLGQGLVVLGGDVTYSMDELVAGGAPNFDRIHALRPRRVYLSHSAGPWNRVVD